MQAREAHRYRARLLVLSRLAMEEALADGEDAFSCFEQVRQAGKIDEAELCKTSSSTRSF